MSERLRPKYLVSKVKIDGSVDHSTTMKATDPGNPNSPFVLMPLKDPAAFLALVTYANYCEPDLAAEVRVWLNKITEADSRLGSQGARNYTHMRKDIIMESMRA